MNDYVLSLVRTWVPVAVGSVLSYLAVRFGIGVDEDVSNQITVGVTAVVVAAYYALVRALEARWPWFGKLLGAKRAPAYVEKR